MNYVSELSTISDPSIPRDSSRAMDGIDERSLIGAVGAPRKLAGGFDVITRQQYIAWVQRSLNRIYRAGLETNGLKTTYYKNLIRKFQRDRGLPETGSVDSPTQNKIIKANEGNRAYMSWVHKALECDSVFSDPPRKRASSRGSYKSYGLKQGIKMFQGRQGLGQDGYVGSKTELKLIQCCRCKPPGSQGKKKPKEPEIDYDAALYNQLKKAQRAIEDHDTYVGDAATLCLIQKLLKSRVDDRYIDARRTNQYFRDSFKDHPEFAPYFLSAKRTLSAFLRARWERGGRVTVDDFIRAINRIKMDMERGMNVAYSRLTGENMYEKFRRTRIKQTFRTLVKSSRSLYNCKFSIAHYKKTIVRA